APDVQSEFVEPHDGSGEFPGEFCRCQDNLHGLPELLFVGLAPVKELQQGFGCVLLDPVVGKKSGVYGDKFFEGEGGDHRGVADGLQFHVATVLSALQLNDHQVGALVDTQQVDAPAAVLPISELFCNDKCVRAQDFNS